MSTLSSGKNKKSKNEHDWNQCVSQSSFRWPGCPLCFTVQEVNFDILTWISSHFVSFLSFLYKDIMTQKVKERHPCQQIFWLDWCRHLSPKLKESVRLFVWSEALSRSMDEMMSQECDSFLLCQGLHEKLAEITRSPLSLPEKQQRDTASLNQHRLSR